MDFERILEYLTEAKSLVSRAARGYYEDEDLANLWEFRRRERQIAQAVERVLGDGHGRALRQMAHGNEWGDVKVVLDQAIYAMGEGRDIALALGPEPGPTLRADSLHPTVWTAVETLWRTEHRREAIGAAARNVNAALQHRLGRRDISESDLVMQAFSSDPPKAGEPRLRIHPDDNSKTYESIHRGARDFGSGCFRAIRNPRAHDIGDEPSEQEALEQLAAFSILARWIEAAELVTVDDE